MLLLLIEKSFYNLASCQGRKLERNDIKKNVCWKAMSHWPVTNSYLLEESS